jgi:response regulator RpfG family c-di-GMP phosphodiesterase/sensor domain CHASE-containing protein
MTLRKKTLTTLIILIVVFLLLLDAVFSGILIHSAAQTDMERMQQKLSQVAVALTGESRTLSAIAGNWAFSDYAWNYMHGTNPNYESSTLNRNILTKIGISSMIFIANDHSIRLFKDYSAPEDPSSPESEFRAIFGDVHNKNLFRDAGKEGINGIVVKGKEPVFFSVKPILTSKMAGPAAGFLIVTRTVSPQLISDISQKLDFNFSIQAATDEDKRNSGKLKDIEVAPEKRSGNLSGHRLLRDDRGTPALWITAISPKIDIPARELELQELFAIFAVIALILCFIFDRLFRKNFSKRMAQLQKESEDLRDGITQRDGITVDKKNDEISRLQRILSDTVTYRTYRQANDTRVEGETIRVYKEFADVGAKLCFATLEEIATSFSPGNDGFRKALSRVADMTERFCIKLGLDKEDAFYARIGAFYSRIGLLGIPFAIRSNDPKMLTWEEQREYHKYPLISRDFLESISVMRPAIPVPFCWNENWDGSGFPNSTAGAAIPITARAFAIADEWNELTRPWPGRAIPSDSEVETHLRSLAGTRLDPRLVESFIAMLRG